jgi:GTPase SAR1 family protein
MTDQPDEPNLPPVVKRLQNGQKTPICVIMVGMAGSGKTTLMTQLERSLEDAAFEKESKKKELIAAAESEKPPAAEDTSDAKAEAEAEASEQEESNEETETEPTSPCYCVNLDPATLLVPYNVSIDIRDTVDYKQVMKQHKLGPNGAIMTSLNLFATKFDQVMSILEKRAYGPPEAKVLLKEDEEQEQEQEQDIADEPDESMDYILVDTPGQIEAFTWSASGAIMSESLASAFPTVLCFVVDTVRCASSPNTFMSNMLYACSMLYRTRLPLVICFNKTDVVSHEFCLEWMRDYEAFQQALDDVSESAGFYGSLTRSLSLVLDEFYSNFANAVGVSAVTGDGMDDFWKTIDKAAREDFATDYVEDLKNRIEEQTARKQALARSSIQRLQRDIDAKEEE